MPALWLPGRHARTDTHLHHLSQAVLHIRSQRLGCLIREPWQVYAVRDGLDAVGLNDAHVCCVPTSCVHSLAKGGGCV